MFENDRKEPRLHQAIVVAIDGNPPSANARPGNVHEQRRISKQWREDMATLAGESKRRWERKHGQKWASLSLAAMRITFVLKGSGRHDWDNLVSSVKPLIDGIVDAGLINDDSIYVLPHVYTDFVIGSTRSTIFEISEPADA